MSCIDQTELVPDWSPTLPEDLLDSHVHLWSADLLSYPYGPHDDVAQPHAAYDSERLQDSMQSAGVQQALAIQPRLLGYDHAYLLEVTRQFAPALRALPLVNLARSSNIDEMTQLANHAAVAGFRAIALDQVRVNALVDSGAEQLWASLSQRNLPVGILASPLALPAIATLARRHPDLTIVVDHLGGITATDWLRLGPSLLALAASPNVYVKLSALGHLSAERFPYADTHLAVREVVAEFGAARTMWGSDLPHALTYGDYGKSAQALTIALAGRAVPDRALIFGDTARAVFKFPAPNHRQRPAS